MTQDQNNNPLIKSIVEKAKDILPPEDVERVQKYLEKGGLQLAPDTCRKFFELYLNGNDEKEIHRLNKAFPYEAILIARVKYNWDEERDKYIVNLQNSVREKVIKAQLETTSLLSDLLSAANKFHGDKIKKFLQSNDPNDLKGALNIETIHNLIKIVEGLQKVTGQDRIQKITTESTQNLNLNVNATQNQNLNAPSGLSPEAASKLLEIIAEEKRKNKK